MTDVIVCHCLLAEMGPFIDGVVCSTYAVHVGTLHTMYENGVAWNNQEWQVLCSALQRRLSVTLQHNQPYPSLLLG